ncbi:MAG: M20 family metallopeptidase [Haloarculaceae archaeon]
MAYDIETFHRRAVETPSHESVAEMRDLLVETLADAGVEARVDDMGNVIAERGAGDEPHVVLNTHIDTVPPHVPCEVDGDVVRGRGACDAKGPLAALVAAFLRADAGSGRLTLAVTPDEETAQTGAAHLTERLSADAYVVGEPTGLDVCTAARGQFEGTVTIRGSAAHAAEPASGANAIRAVAPILQAMESYDETVGPAEHEQLGRPTLTPTLIDGGEAANQIPAECTITFDRRSVPPEDPAVFRDQLQAHLESWVPDSMGLSVALAEREAPILEAFATPSDSDVARALVDAGAGATRPFGAATEASLFAADAPTVVFGPGELADDEGAVAHSEREYVRLPDVERAGEIATTAVSSLLS